MMKTETKRLYAANVRMDQTSRDYLLACYRNHLVIYNEMIDHYRKNRSIGLKELKEELARRLGEGAHNPVIWTALHTEIYYMHKKGDFRQKLWTCVQYMSTMSKGYARNAVLHYDEKNKTISLIGHPVVLHLDEPLPLLPSEDSVIYMNLSYSGSTGDIALNVCM